MPFKKFVEKFSGRTGGVFEAVTSLGINVPIFVVPEWQDRNHSEDALIATIAYTLGLGLIPVATGRLGYLLGKYAVGVPLGAVAYGVESAVVAIAHAAHRSRHADEANAIYLTQVITDEASSSATEISQDSTTRILNEIITDANQQILTLQEKHKKELNTFTAELDAFIKSIKEYAAANGNYAKNFKHLKLEIIDSMRCPLSLDIPNIPVTMNGNKYDLDYLVKIKPNREGYRINPLNRNLFTLNQIAPDFDKRAQIENMIAEAKLKQGKKPANDDVEKGHHKHKSRRSHR